MFALHLAQKNNATINSRLLTKDIYLNIYIYIYIFMYLFLAELNLCCCMDFFLVAENGVYSSCAHCSLVSSPVVEHGP